MTESDAVESVSNATTENVVLPSYLRELLETIAIREGFADGYNIISRAGSNVGDGFQGIMLSVVISGTRNGSCNDELVLICKIPPLSEMRQKYAITPFKQEIAAYEKLLPMLVEFQREKGITEADGFYAFPKCYGTYADEEKLHFAIVLEDLRHTGFRMWNKYESIDLKHVQLALTQLGKFHALSFALRQQQPEMFAQFQSFTPAVLSMFKDRPEIAAMFENNFDRTINLLHPDDKDEIAKITHLRDNFIAIYKASIGAEIHPSSEAESFKVFCHGDFWNNNMMFQYSSADSLDPQRAVLIDWQMCQYAPPATDISYYLFSSTEQSLRTAHYDDILHAYHASLAELLERLGGDADNQFSFVNLQSQMLTSAIYGLIMAPFLIQAVTVKAEDIPDMDAMTDFNLMSKRVPDAYKVRVRDVVRDFVARGLFTEKHLELMKSE